MTQWLETESSGCQYLPDMTQTREDPSPNQWLLPLTAKVESNGHLQIGGCDVVQLVSQFGSPLYIVDEETLRTACRQYHQAFTQCYPGPSQVLYASKAWSSLAICTIVASEGLGLDVASGGELYTAIQADISPDLIYLHGNNKSISELQLAVNVGCTIVVDNWFELKTLVTIRAQGVESASGRIPIMLRVTPGIECHTHDYIRTGQLDSKFGFDPGQLEEVFRFISEQSTLHCVGLHAHIGSQIFELQPHRDLPAILVQWLSKAAQYGLPVNELNIGGGLGMRYTEADDPPAIAEWAKTVCSAVIKACEDQTFPLPKLVCEPGRSIIGPACVTAYTVGSQKVIPGIRSYLAIDGGMSDNPRPITYQSRYRAVVANRMTELLSQTMTIAGKHCESGDVLIRDATLPPTVSGDVIVVMGTGAYNYSMASNYNRFPRPAAILVNSGDASLILRRETYPDLLRQDCLPERLKG